jgi:hypothetical protein
MLHNFFFFVIEAPVKESICSSQTLSTTSNICMQSQEPTHAVRCVRNKYLVLSALKHSSLLVRSNNDEEKRLIASTTGHKALKLYCSYFTNVRNKPVFIPGRPFQPSLMFASKARAYPNQTSVRCFILGQAHTYPYPQTLE